MRTTIISFLTTWEYLLILIHTLPITLLPHGPFDPIRLRLTSGQSAAIFGLKGCKSGVYGKMCEFDANRVKIAWENAE